MLEIVALAATLQQQSNVHVVAAGETLSGIAGPAWPSVCAANGIANCNLIYVGERINLGGGSYSPSPSSVYTPPVAHYSAPVYHSSSSGSGGSLSDVPGVPSGFAACVAEHESSNGANQAYNGGVYGIINASGYHVNGQSIAAQKQAFSALYAADGTAPWAPYDGC